MHSLTDKSVTADRVCCCLLQHMIGHISPKCFLKNYQDEFIQSTITTFILHGANAKNLESFNRTNEKLLTVSAGNPYPPSDKNFTWVIIINSFLYYIIMWFYSRATVRAMRVRGQTCNLPCAQHQKNELQPRTSSSGFHWQVKAWGDYEGTPTHTQTHTDEALSWRGCYMFSQHVLNTKC